MWEGVAPSSATCWAPAQRVVTDCAVVCGIWQPRAESPLLGWLITAGFPAPMPGNSEALCHPQSSCGDPETTMSHLGFYPASPPKHLSDKDVPHWKRLLKVLILRLLLYHFPLTADEAPPNPEVYAYIT